MIIAEINIIFIMIIKFFSIVIAGSCGGVYCFIIKLLSLLEKYSFKVVV